MRDFEDMTVGMILDFIITFNNENLQDEDREDEVRMANQSDFDRF